MERHQCIFRLRLLAALLICFASVARGADSEVATHAVTVDDRMLFVEALTLTEQGRWAEAAQLFGDIASRHPAWPEPKNNLAVAMLKLGKLEKAQQALEDAVGSQPSFRTAQQNRQRLYDHLAAVAYDRALGKTETNKLPQLDLLTRLAPPEKPAPTRPERMDHGDATAEGSIQQRAEMIRSQLMSWSKAWSDADVEAYLAAYSGRFTPGEPGKDYNQWRNIRRARLTMASNTQVSLDDIRIYFAPTNEQALAQFIQSYRSDNYQDRVIKQLRLGLEKGQWLILSERVIEKLN